jgi:hypothetical protein
MWLPAENIIFRKEIASFKLAAKSLFLFHSYRPLKFYNVSNPSSLTTTLEFTQPLIEMSTRIFSWGKGRPTRKDDALTALFEPIVRVEVFTVVAMKNGVFWDVTPCGPCKNRYFGGT